MTPLLIEFTGKKWLVTKGRTQFIVDTMNDMIAVVTMQLEQKWRERRNPDV